MPEHLIDVGGYRLNANIAGNGSPSLVLLSCLGAGAEHWRNIFPQLTELTTCLVYGRAGLGGSDPLPHAASQAAGGMKAATAELRSLLRRAGLKPPFVFLTSSIGAFLAEAYTLAWSQDVAGEIFLDPTNMTSLPIETPLHDTLDEADGAGHRFSWRSLWAELLRPRPPIRVPTVVVSSATDSWRRWPPGDVWWSPFTLEEMDHLWQNHQGAWAHRLQATHVVARDADHIVHFDAPELIVHIVAEVLSATRRGDLAIPTHPDEFTAEGGDIVGKGSPAS